MDIRKFLEQFDDSELKNIGVLNTKRNLLNSKSVESLIQLMKQSNIDKLEGPEDWFLDINYNFCNPKSNLKQTGNLKQSQTRLGVVFDFQNNILNPHYRSFDKNQNNENSSQNSPQEIYKQKIILDTTVFANEDISKPENRINLSLFSLFLIDDFRSWFLEQFDLPQDSVIFPSTNLKGGIRPDFAVNNKEDKPIAYIEVEIGREDIGQLQNFRSMLNVPVFSVCGKKEHEGHLSLLEIYDKLNEVKEKIKSKQFNKNFAVYETLIYENVLSYGRERYKSTTISDEMRNSFLIQNLMDHLEIHEDVGRTMRPGEFLLETKKEFGFSLRIYSRESKIRNSLSIMARSGGRPRIIFPSKEKLEKYLPSYKQPAINELCNFLKRFGYHIDTLPERSQARIDINLVEGNIDKFIAILEKLGEI
ncbi:MAG: hypothetical protein K9N09_02565 [Candidatus Cloacimonetes bacterium]|nr:hypothetical protein [Candidatus Cloacimonadota bacterium]MCF7813110.1 hypothetical protein [Candidatus Cloacimonadota bacterium]MCF7867558.1 hypothetical protein [Candidatus Cloacimonadota bacterium]MCF7883048.1 hypothetical protein [Candidatus Cloacimonadota bacterium]